MDQKKQLTKDDQIINDVLCVEQHNRLIHGNNGQQAYK